MLPATMVGAEVGNQRRVVDKTTSQLEWLLLLLLSVQRRYWQQQKGEEELVCVTRSRQRSLVLPFCVLFAPSVQHALYSSTPISTRGRPCLSAE